MSIKIVVDSTSDIPVDLLNKNGIEVVPLTVNFEDKCYLDKVEISAKEFFEKLVVSEKLPTTPQASLGLLVVSLEHILAVCHAVFSIFTRS